MALKKRGNTWHTHFFVDGERFRKSLETSDWREAQRPEWENAALAARLALNTTMRGHEIKGLRWCNVDMIGRTLTVRRSKTEAGERVIPLNADAWEVILALYRRSQKLGGFEPGHFLFPAIKPDHAAKQEGVKGKEKIDPTRPMKSWRTAWRRLTRAIQCPHCGLASVGLLTAVEAPKMQRPSLLEYSDLSRSDDDFAVCLSSLRAAVWYSGEEQGRV